MNTTKDDDDGWARVEIEAPLGMRIMVIDKEENFHVAFRYSDGSWATWGSDTPLEDVTHWRHLPEPPKPKDAFETFWDTLTPDECRGNEFRYAFKNHGMLFKPTAKLVWEAAINSTKQC